MAQKVAAVTPAAAAARLNRIAKALERKGIRALTETAKDGAILGQSLSRGPYSLVALALMDHPYARRHGYALLDPNIINRQAGRFFSAWKAEAVRSAFNGTLIALTTNRSDVAKYLKWGTRYMVRRPIGDEVRERLRPNALIYVRQAVREALRTK